MTRPCATCAETEPPSRRLYALVHANRALLAWVARSEGLAGEDVFDAVQEAFGAYVARFERPDASPTAARRTLVALTRNIARNRRRLHAVTRPHLGDDATEALEASIEPPDARMEAAEEHERLACCVARLADLQRAVVTLRMLEEIPGQDVARQLGISPGHVAVLLHRAKSQLATCLSEDP